MSTRKPRAKKVPKKIRTAVLARDDHRCQYPTARGICAATENLVIHDTTLSGEHKGATDCVTLCMVHHNQTTADYKYAAARMRDIQARLKAYGDKQLELALG